MKRKYLQSLTLLEILISVTIITLVMGGVVVALQQALSIFKINSSRTELSGQAASAADWLVKDISDSCCLFSANNTSLVLNTASDGYVKYKFENNTLSRALLRVSNQTTPITTNILTNAFQLSYYNAYNQPISDIANNTDKVTAIGINITTQKEGRTFRLNTLGRLNFSAAKCPWAWNYGCGNTNEINSIQQTSDGGYILGGGYKTGTYNDFLFIKTDYLGRREWAKTYAVMSEYHLVSSINQTSDAGYIAAGGVSPYAPLSSFLVVKTTADGTKDWSKRYYTGNSTKYVEINSIQQTSDGYILGGWTGADGAGGEDFLVVKLLPNGTVNWTRAYGGTGTDKLFALEQTSDGGYILGGYSHISGTMDCLLLKITSTGTKSWAKIYGTSEVETPSTLDQTSDGGYILGGYRKAYAGSDYDALVIKTDSNGNVGATYNGTWAKTYNYTDNDIISSIQQTSDGGYIVGGITWSTGKDFLVMKVLANGTLDNTFGTTGAKTYGGSSIDELRAIQQTPDGSYVFAGMSLSFCSNTNSLFVKTDSLGNLGYCKIAQDVSVVAKDYALNLSNVTSSVTQTNISGFPLSNQTITVNPYDIPYSQVCTR